jgi:MYXO-CTERM domain-containing protein
MRFASSLLIAAAVFLLEPVAHACSGDCSPANTVPGSNDAVMPVNAAGLRWLGGVDVIDAVVLRDVEADLTLPIAFEQAGWMYDLRPADPLEVGKTYRFELPDNGCGEPLTRTFSTTEPVELSSSSLGTLVAEPPELTLIDVPESVSCFIQVPAVSVRIELELDPQLEPFAALLVYRTLVDGESWGHIPHDFAPSNIGGSWRGRGVDEVFATCPSDSSEGVSLGAHQVQMRATIPGLPGVVLESDVVEIVLECGEEESGDDELGGESGSFIAPEDPSVEDDERGGCSCSSDGERSPALVIAPLLVLLACGRRRLTS